MLPTKFQNIIIQKETFKKKVKNYVELRNIANTSFNLDEKIPKFRVVRGILRFLFEKFGPNVT